MAVFGLMFLILVLMFGLMPVIGGILYYFVFMFEVLFRKH